MQTDHRPSADDTERNLGRRGFLTLSALVAGGSALGSLGSVTGAPVDDQSFETPRWSTFRSILPARRGFLLTGIRTNSASEQVGWAVRLDDELDVVWNRAYLSPRHLRQTDRGEDHDGIEFALSDGSGGFLLVGWWHTLGSDSRYAWLTYIGADGISRWSRVYNRDGVNSFRDDFADGVATDDGFLLVGRTIASEYLDERRGDGWVVEIERGRRGRILWQRAYDPNGTSDGWDDDDRHSEFNAVASVDDGYLLVGETSPDGPTESTNTAAWALRIGDDGDPRWSRGYRLDRRRNNEFRDVAAVDDGFFVAGVAGAEESVRELHDYKMRGRSWAAKLDERGRLIWEDASGGDGFHAVEATEDGAVFVGRRDGRGWVAAYDGDGNRLGSDRSSVPGSEYFALTTRTQGSLREYLPVGYGREDASTNGLLSRFAASDFDGSGDDGSDDNDDDETERLFEIIATETGEVRYELTVDGDIEPARLNDRVKAEDSDQIRENDDGTVTVRGSTGNEGYGDAFRFTGEVTEFRSRAEADFFIRLDGDRVSVDELLGEDDDDDDDDDDETERLFEIIATETGEVRYELTVDGDIEPARLSDRVKAEDDDRIRENNDGTVTVSGSTGNEGYGDAFRFTGEVTAFRSRGEADFYIRLDGDRVSVDELLGEDDDDDDDDDDSERLFEIIATETGEVRYELTVDGDIEPARLSDRVKAEDDDRIRENNDGTVTVSGSTGNEGYGDAFRFTGTITGFRSRAEADFFIRLDGDRVSVDELLDD